MRPGRRTPRPLGSTSSSELRGTLGPPCPGLIYSVAPIRLLTGDTGGGRVEHKVHVLIFPWSVPSLTSLHSSWCPERLAQCEPHTGQGHVEGVRPTWGGVD